MSGEVWTKESGKGLITIRAALESDNAEIRGLYQYFNSLSTADRAMLNISPKYGFGSGTIVAEAGGHLVGFAKYWKDASKGEDFYHFYRAVVKPEFRREKIYFAFFLLRMKYSGGRRFEVTPSEDEAKAVRPAVEKIAEKLGLTLEITPMKALIVHVSSNINLQELENKIDAFLNALGWIKHG